MTTTPALVFALALVLFLGAAVLWWWAREVPAFVLALGLAVLTVATGLSLRPVPPEPIPPEPPPTGTDFGGYRPHYQGHGTRTPGGRGGDVRRVNTAAQLAEAVRARAGCANTAATCARVVIFETSGPYDLGNQLTIDSPFLTLAGQTAPDDGVTLVNTRLLVDTHDVVVQHLRVRQPPQLLNTCSVGDAGDGGDNSHVYNVVLDHLTCTWSNEVNNYLQARPGSHDVALLDSLIGEALWPMGWGGIGAGIGERSTTARTLFTQAWGRQPIWGATGDHALVNNVTYNGTDSTPGGSTLPAFFGDGDGESDPAAAEQTVIVNNVLIPGPNSGSVAAFLGLSKKQGSIDAGSKIYLSGNQGPGVTGPDGDGQWAATICTGSYGTYANAATCGRASNLRTDTPFTWWLQAQAVVLPTNQVLASVLAQAGARPLNRDAADLRMIADVQQGTGTHFLAPNAPVQPTLRAQTRTCNLPSDPNGPGTRVLADGSLNTALDDWLESDPVCGARRLEPWPARRRPS